MNKEAADLYFKQGEKGKEEYARRVRRCAQRSMEDWCAQMCSEKDGRLILRTMGWSVQGERNVVKNGFDWGGQTALFWNKALFGERRLYARNRESKIRVYDSEGDVVDAIL